jgi:lysophospholipase L1-like esterase
MISRPVINAGVPGDTTARAMQRLERDVLAYAPDIVLVTLGGNDLKNGVASDAAVIFIYIDFINYRVIIKL